jgi:hypothetical protein
MTWQVSNGPQVAVRKQHCEPPLVLVVVVVVVEGVLPVQLGPAPGAGQASQQLEHEPGIPPLAVHDAASRWIPHFVFRLFVRQHVTKPGFFPQVERLAHLFTWPRQLRFTSVASTCCAAQLT